MPKLTKRFVEAVKPGPKGTAVWDDEVTGFGLRVYPSGKRSYIVQYRARGRSRRYTIGLHGVWTPETARREAKAQLGNVARGKDPAEEREEDRRALTVKQLCEQYIEDMEADLPPMGPSIITRVCGFEICSRVCRSGQARRARSPQIAQALGALQRVFCCPAMSVA